MWSRSESELHPIGTLKNEVDDLNIPTESREENANKPSFICLQDVPLSSATKPVPHKEHPEDPKLLIVPKGQVIHWLEPKVEANLPAGHLRHEEDAVAPTDAEWDPNGHKLHTRLPAREYLPALQIEHPVEPKAAIEYFPAAQMEQKVDPAWEKYPAPHDTHVSSLIACSKVEYFPALQGMQKDEPVVLLYEPGVHLRHDTDPGKE
jgi:hypothetical protein